MASGSIAASESSRSIAEVQVAMTIAKRFPRNQSLACQNIVESCKRKKLAEKATYAYPRGGTMVISPSIRLAEVLAQNWGNLDFGLIELDRKDGESTVMAYCWDMESNVRQKMVFQVPHVRDTKNGPVKLKDARDIYEMTANMGARRMRSCILRVIPGDIIEMALEQCNATLSSGAEPIADRCRKMSNAFISIGVDVPMLEKYLGHELKAIDESELNNLRSIYMSIKDGEAKREDFFIIGKKDMTKEADDDDDDNVKFEDSEPIEKPKAKRGRKPKAEKQEEQPAENVVNLPPEHPLLAEFKKVIAGNEEAVMAYCIESEWIKDGTSFANLSERHLKAVLAQPEAFLAAIK